MCQLVQNSITAAVAKKWAHYTTHELHLLPACARLVLHKALLALRCHPDSVKPLSPDAKEGGHHFKKWKLLRPPAGKAEEASTLRQAVHWPS